MGASSPSAARVSDAGRPITPSAPARILLRATTPSDAPALRHVLASNAETLPLAGVDTGVVDQSRLRDVLETAAGRERGRCLAVVERCTGRVIGLAVLLAPNPADGVPWVAFLIIAADRQNLGLGTEAALALERILGRAGWSEVRLGVLVDNVRALRFWRRLGYRELAGAWRAYNGSRRGTITLAKRLERPPSRWATWSLFGVVLAGLAATTTVAIRAADETSPSSPRRGA